MKTSDESFKEIERLDNIIIVKHQTNGMEYSIPLNQDTGGFAKLLKLYFYYKSNYKYFFIDELDARLHYQLIKSFGMFT